MSGWAGTETRANAEFVWKLEADLLAVRAVRVPAAMPNDQVRLRYVWFPRSRGLLMGIVSRL